MELFKKMCQISKSQLGVRHSLLHFCPASLNPGFVGMNIFLRINNLITECQDGLQGFCRRFSIVFLLGVRQFLIGDKNGTRFESIIAERTVGPALANPTRRPYIVDRFREFLD